MEEISCMRSFKRIFLPIICIALTFFILSTLILEPYLQTEALYYQDSALREKLAGKIDFISVGASNGLCALDTQVLDESLGCFSYNLANSMMTLNSSIFLLEKELARNPVKTVILDISHETFSRYPELEHGEGDIITYARLSTISERIRYLLTCVPLNDWLSIYSYYFVPGAIEYTLAGLKGEQPIYHNVDYQEKGFLPRINNSLQLNEHKINELYNQKEFQGNFRNKNIRQLIGLLELCKEYNVRVILVTFPRSNQNIWEVNGLDLFYDFTIKFAEKYDCEFYDTNLLKSRYELLNDTESFYDGQHMSTEGAATFTKAFCEIIKKAETEDVSDYFYDSYEEMKADSPYMEYLK